MKLIPIGLVKDSIVELSRDDSPARAGTPAWLKKPRRIVLVMLCKVSLIMG
jgi:hypothetical protein